MAVCNVNVAMGSGLLPEDLHRNRLRKRKLGRSFLLTGIFKNNTNLPTQQTKGWGGGEEGMSDSSIS